MKNRFGGALLLIGSALFGAVIWGLLTALGGNFWTGFAECLMFIAMGVVLSTIVWLVTKLPFLPTLPFGDSIEYGYILLIGIPLVKTGLSMINIPDWISWACGVVIAVWACRIEYRRKQKGKS